MTVANQSTATSLAININTQGTKVLSQLKLQLTALVQRIQWHLHAYGIVFKVMLLTIGSLIFLYVHWVSRNILSVVKSEKASN